MAIYHYIGRTVSGKEIKGTMDAYNRNEVIASLRRQEIYPVKIEGEEQVSRNITITKRKKKITNKDLSVYCRQFSTIIDSGISLIECLDILRKQTDNSYFRTVIDEMYEDVQKGMALSKSMKKFNDVFPEILINMVESGEVSGQLSDIMMRMAEHFEKENELISKVRGAMIYPVILITVSLGVSFILLAFVLPGFVAMFEGFGVALPTPTRILLGVGNFIKAWWYLIIAAILLSIYGMNRYLKSEEGRIKFDGLKLRMPIFGKVNKKIATSRFSRSLSTLLQSGIPIIESLELVSKVLDNHYLQEGIMTSLESIKKGDSIASSIGTMNVFPPMLVSMLKIGEDTGSINNLLETTADFYDREVDFAIESMVQLINPVVILFMAVVVGSIVLAVALPMFDMYNYLSF